MAAHECIVENTIVRRIAPACVEDTGGYFVATPEDTDRLRGRVRCRLRGDRRAVRRGRRCLAPGPRAGPESGDPAGVPRPDAAVEPWQLIEANVADARTRGGDAWPYHRVVSMARSGGRILGVDVVDVRSGSLRTIHPRIVVSATGAWAGMVAALAGVELAMAPGKGTMLIFNQRMTDTVINRLKRPGDGDIMVPVHSVAILGTTEEEVDDPDVYEIRREEVALLLAEGEKLFPGLSRLRLLRAYAGVRPLYREEPTASERLEAGAGTDDGRAISRAHVVIDHGPRDGVDNFVSIVGGKLTTYRLMAKQTADVVVRKLGLSAPCTTADEVLPNQGDGRTYWLGHRLAEHEAAGGGDADLICECELVTRPALDAFLDARWPCDLDDVRRGTRLGMGPCQGGFCTFRAAGMLAERAAASGTAMTPGLLDATLNGFLTERFRGDRPIASGRQLQELWLTTALYAGVLGLESLPRDEPDVVG